jgi:hypothetical protein
MWAPLVAVSYGRTRDGHRIALEGILNLLLTNQDDGRVGLPRRRHGPRQGAVVVRRSRAKGACDGGKHEADQEEG